MSINIKSPAFAGGNANYTPLDEDESWLSGHAALVNWVSGDGIAMRDIDNIWDDRVFAARSYAPSGAGDLAATPSTRVNGRPSIRCPGRGLKSATVTIPASYTILMTAQIDALSGATQIMVGGAASAFPRFGLQISGTGQPTLAHNAPGSAVGIAAVVTPGVPFLLGADFNATTKAANIYRDSVSTGGAVTFAESHPATAGFGIGQLGDNGSPMTGDIRDVVVFSAVLSQPDRARAMRVLARRAGVTVAGI